MTEYRFSYNPFTKDFIVSDTSHAIAILNKGKQKKFDEYIRGIVVKEVLYLRTYYPFPLTYGIAVTELNQKSRTLLETYKEVVLKQIKEFKIKEIKFNVDNDLLKGIGLANI